MTSSLTKRLATLDVVDLSISNLHLIKMCSICTTGLQEGKFIVCKLCQRKLHCECNDPPVRRYYMKNP